MNGRYMILLIILVFLSDGFVTLLFAIIVMLWMGSYVHVFDVILRFKVIL